MPSSEPASTPAATTIAVPLVDEKDISRKHRENVNFKIGVLKAQTGVNPTIKRCNAAVRGKQKPKNKKASRVAKLELKQLLELKRAQLEHHDTKVMTSILKKGVRFEIQKLSKKKRTAIYNLERVQKAGSTAPKGLVDTKKKDIEKCEKMAAALKTLKLANMAAVSVGMVGFLGKCKLESLEMTKNIERLLLKHYPDLEGEPTVALDTIAPKDSGDTDSDSDSDSSSSSDSDSDSDGDDKASEASKKTRESKEKTEASASTSDSSSGSDSDGETKVKQEEVSATSKAETPSAAVEPKAFTETGEKATSTTEGKPTVTDTPKGTDEDKPVAKKVLGPPNVVRLAAIRLLRSEPVEKVRQEILVREKERAEKERIEAEKEDVRKEAQRKAKEKKRAVLADDGSEDDLPGMIKAPEKKKRNRMSQQARRKLAEETHGNEANHIKNSKPRDANKPKDVTKDAKPKQPVVEIPADVHASWAAAMKRKAQTEAKFDGKKMKFDD